MASGGVSAKPGGRSSPPKRVTTHFYATDPFELIHAMIDKIEVAASDQRGKADVALIGALAAIVECAPSPNENAASEGGDVGRVLVVAGAGCQRYLGGVSFAQA